MPGPCSTLLVARFQDDQDAARYVGELSPTAASAVELGRTVMVQAGPGAAAVGALAWQCGGRIVSTAAGVRTMPLVICVGAPGGAGLGSPGLGRALAALGEFRRHGLELYGITDASGGDGSPTSLRARADQLAAIAAEHQVITAAELVPGADLRRLHRALAARFPHAVRERLWEQFPSANAALAAVAELDVKLAAAGRYVVIEATDIPARLGRIIHRHGGVGQLIAGDAVRLAVTLRGSPEHAIELPELLTVVRAHGRADDQLELSVEGGVVSGWIETFCPAAALFGVVEAARVHGLEVDIEAGPRDRLLDALTRIARDVRHSVRASSSPG